MEQKQSLLLEQVNDLILDIDTSTYVDILENSIEEGFSSDLDKNIMFDFMHNIMLQEDVDLDERLDAIENVVFNGYVQEGKASGRKRARRAAKGTPTTTGPQRRATNRIANKGFGGDGNVSASEVANAQRSKQAKTDRGISARAADSRATSSGATHVSQADVVAAKGRTQVSRLKSTNPGQSRMNKAKLAVGSAAGRIAGSKAGQAVGSKLASLRKGFSNKKAEAGKYISKKVDAGRKAIADKASKISPDLNRNVSIKNVPGNLRKMRNKMPKLDLSSFKRNKEAAQPA
jgi:hypothetical protein